MFLCHQSAFIPPLSITSTALVRRHIQNSTCTSLIRPALTAKLVSMARAPVDSTRVTVLKTGTEPKTSTHVLYWMSTALRTSDNPALEHAAYLSNRLRVPLRVAHLLHRFAPDEEPLPERHALFQLEGVRDVANALRNRNVPFCVVRPSHGSMLDTLLRLASGAASVVTDADYLRPGRALRKDFARALRIPLYVVEANVVVPVEEVSEKAEHAARTIRPKITRLVPQYLKQTPTVDLKYQDKDKDDDDDDSSNGLWDGEDEEVLIVNNDENVEDVLASWEGLDRDAKRVTGFPGGEIAAKKRLHEFVNVRLTRYGEGRNEPALQLVSDLSPYLRAGNISPIEIVLAVKSVDGGKGKTGSASSDSFLEELIVRRELAVNACWYNEEYDKYESVVPRFAQESLALHASDKRSHIYSYDELEAGVTHDAYWNAAQLEMVARGKMHGYMRMYWAKQIVGWTKTPEEALEVATRLNNRWELDAVDPNSYVGVNWCFGLHDQGWRERPVWGKVRYMNDAGLRRKFNMGAYLAAVDKLVTKNGLPSHISKTRQQRNVKIQTQTTLNELGSRKKGRSSNSSSTRPTKRSKS